MSRPIWTGSVGFGLVNIPVAIIAGLRPADEPLHERHGVDGSPIERRVFCSREDIEISRDEIARAYEWDDRMIPVTDSEIESVAPYPSKTIDIERFVPVDGFDRALVDRPYFLEPAEKGEGSLRSYALLARILAETGRAAIARFVMRSGERLAAISAAGDRLRLRTIHFPAELRDPESVETGADEVGKREVEETARLLRELALDWTPAQLDDFRAQRIRRLAREKLARGELVRPENETEPAQEEDLMGALQKSLDEAYKKGHGRPSRRGGTPGRPRQKGRELTRDELYERAKRMDIPGRSKMSKRELEEAILD